MALSSLDKSGHSIKLCDLGHFVLGMWTLSAFAGSLNLLRLLHAGGSNEDSANDDSMLVSEENLQWKDPITQCDIEHPVKNTVCGHIYDKNSIAHYIKTTKHPRYSKHIEALIIFGASSDIKH